ncbi:MAG: hypothetical protein PHE51_05495 [Eubacteriales bacterium]|nr:hypothetical protein [Eubacteriales bacterium]
MDITHNFYTEHFGGDIIPDEFFPSYSTRAMMYLDSITFNKASKTEDINIQFAVCDIAEMFYTNDKTGGITHESVDGYSVTRSEDDFLQKLSETAQLYLSCTGLLYRGGASYVI